VNLRVTDYLTGKKTGKGSYFPLRDGNNRAETELEESREEPLLLDPACSSDCKLLCFDSENGRPISRYKPEEDAWRNERARASIEYYHLDEATWNVKRKDLMDEVSVLCDRILENAATGADRFDQYEALLAELLRYLDPFSEFTSAAYQIAQEKGILEHVFPVPG
jgi:hypothetical protein